jgi:hypothetical protein
MVINYSKRIERPSYQSLIRLKMQLDELSFSRGNRFCNHSILIIINFAYIQIHLTTSLSYSFIKDFCSNHQVKACEQKFYNHKKCYNQEVWTWVFLLSLVQKMVDVFVNVSFQIVLTKAMMLILFL